MVVEKVFTQSRKQIPLRRVCPYYRLPQLRPGQSLSGRERLPVCAVGELDAHVSFRQAQELCRSGEYPTCDWFRRADPNWAKGDTAPIMVGAAARSGNAAGAETHPLSRQLLSSALWVVGIPTAITLIIIMAIWVTENVWMPTQQIIVDLIR